MSKKTEKSTKPTQSTKKAARKVSVRKPKEVAVQNIKPAIVQTEKKAEQNLEQNVSSIADQSSKINVQSDSKVSNTSKPVAALPGAISYAEARKQVEKIKGFYASSVAFVLVNALLFSLDWADNNKINWAYWSLLGWGIGQAMQAFDIYVGKNWEEKKMRELMSGNKN